MGDESSKSATLYALDLFQEFEDWGGIRPPDEIAAWDQWSDLVCSNISALPLDNNNPNYTKTLGAPTPCKPTAPLYHSMEWTHPPGIFIGTVFLLCVLAFPPPYAFTGLALATFMYTSHLRTPSVTPFRMQSISVISTLYIPSIQVHISHISRRRMYPSQICIYSHFRCISLRSPTAVWDPVNFVYTLTSSAYLPHLPPRCVPLFRVYLFSWCLSCCCVYVSLLTRAYKKVSQTSTNFLKRLEKESSPPLCMPFVWMHSLTPAHPAHRRASSVCICPRC